MYSFLKFTLITFLYNLFLNISLKTFLLFLFLFYFIHVMTLKYKIVSITTQLILQLRHRNQILLLFRKFSLESRKRFKSSYLNPYIVLKAEKSRFL